MSARSIPTFPEFTRAQLDIIERDPVYVLNMRQLYQRIRAGKVDGHCLHTIGSWLQQAALRRYVQSHVRLPGMTSPAE